MYILYSSAETILFFADLIHITIPKMRYDTYHDALQLNENMKKDLKLIQSGAVLRTA